MDYDMFPAADFRAKFPDQLLPGSAAVASGGNENGDLRLRISAPDLGQHLRDDCLAWHRAGVVTCQQYNFMLSLCQLPQRGTADGILQGLGYQCISGSRWLFLRKTVSGNGKDPRVRDLGCNLAVSIGQCNSQTHLLLLLYRRRRQRRLVPASAVETNITQNTLEKYITENKISLINSAYMPYKKCMCAFV